MGCRQLTKPISTWQWEPAQHLLGSGTGSAAATSGRNAAACSHIPRDETAGTKPAASVGDLSALQILSCV